MTKEQARVFVKAEKNKMTPAQIHENSRQIIDRLISQDFFCSADTILTYVSYNQEVETHPFIDNCLRRRYEVPPDYSAVRIKARQIRYFRTR